jgi:hypothetical protein
VSGGSLRHLAILLWLDGVNEIRESDCILDKEDGNVVSNNIKVALVGVKASSKAVNIASGVCRTAGAGDGGETEKDWSLFSRSIQKACGGNVGKVSVGFKNTVGTCSCQSQTQCAINRSYQLHEREQLARVPIYCQNVTHHTTTLSLTLS